MSNVNNKTDEAILAKLIQLNADTSECVPIFHSVPITIKAKLILELGVRGGISTLAFLVACRKLKAKLISVDTDPCEEAQQKIIELGLQSHWTFVQCDDRHLLKFWEYKMVDLIFIDTDHNYEHTLKELRVCRQLLKRNGIILLHDTLAVNYPFIKKAIDHFLKRHSEEFRYYELGTKYGLGMLRKQALYN